MFTYLPEPLDSGMRRNDEVAERGVARSMAIYVVLQLGLR
jgi:hypothetical protein